MSWKHEWEKEVRSIRDKTNKDQMVGSGRDILNIHFDHKTSWAKGVRNAFDSCDEAWAKYTSVTGMAAKKSAAQEFDKAYKELAKQGAQLLASVADMLKEHPFKNAMAKHGNALYRQFGAMSLEIDGKVKKVKAAVAVMQSPPARPSSPVPQAPSRPTSPVPKAPPRPQQGPPVKP